MEIGRVFERISLPVEGELLKSIKKDLGDGEINDVVVVGTDSNFALAKGLREIFPQADIAVIDRDKKINKWAAKSLSEKDKISVVVGEVVGDGGDIGKADMVVAKHLIHLVKDTTKILDDLAEMVEPGGKLVVSVPKIMEKKVAGSVYNLGWPLLWNEVGEGIQSFVVWKLFKRRTVGQ